MYNIFETQIWFGKFNRYLFKVKKRVKSVLIELAKRNMIMICFL